MAKPLPRRRCETSRSSRRRLGAASSAVWRRRRHCRSSWRLMTAQWLGVFVSYMLLTDPDTPIFQEIISLLSVYACINVATVAIAIGGKWLIVGRIKPGRYPLWGVYYLPVVAGAATDHADPLEVVPRLAADELFSGRARRESRRRCASSAISKSVPSISSRSGRARASVRKCASPMCASKATNSSSARSILGMTPISARPACWRKT